MDADPELFSPTGAPPPWYPLGLTDRAFDIEALADGVPSPWGRFHGWDPSDVMLPEWWGAQAKEAWGKWPSSVHRVELVRHHRWGFEVRLDERWTAHIYPLFTGHDVSTIALHEPWRASSENTELLMPTAGLKRTLGDAVTVFPLHEMRTPWEHESAPAQRAAMCGRLHSALVGHATPNTERRWNARLKAIEDRLKTSTLWRAPHTSAVVGLPTVRPGFGVVDEVPCLVPQPRPLVEHLLCSPERRPGVAVAASLEQSIAIHDGFEGEVDRLAFYDAWAGEVPPAWSSATAFSSANGGVWIWRYEAMLLLLAEGRAFSLNDQVKRCEAWLRDVSRIQARLGELRTVIAVRKASMYGAIGITVLVANSAGAWALAAGAACVSVLAHLAYHRRLPEPI